MPTAPVIDAGFLAPIVAQLHQLECSLRLTVEIVDRLRQDVVRLDECSEKTEDALKQLRDSVEGKS